MDLSTLQAALSELPLGPLRYFDSLGSTNDEAARWVEAGAPHLALVVADEQTAGRGRLGRPWLTPPGSALAFSLVLKPGEEGVEELGKWAARLPALGALAVCAALEGYGLHPQMKWPNDVLLEERKVCGILAEAKWQGEAFSSAILGIGVNVSPASVPPDEQVIFPATCVEAALGRPVERVALLQAILERLLQWLPNIGLPAFFQAWEERLAYKDEWIVLSGLKPAEEGSQGETLEARLLGLETDGSLRLLDRRNRVLTVQAGDVRLRSLRS